MSFTTVRLQNLSYVITKGTTPSNIGESFVNQGIKYIRSEMLTSGKYITGEFLHISPETHSKLKRSQLKAGDILFSMAGQYLGKTAILRDSDVPANTNQAVALIRINTEVCNREYVYYYLNLPEVINKINSVSGQAAQPNINLKQIGDIEILLPDKERQNKIVSVISLFDSLIENNQKQIKLLEEAAQRLYKEWFVDLRFPGYENSIFENDIPCGWEFKKFSDLAEIVMGTSPKSEFYNTNHEGIPFHQGVGSYGKRFVNDDVYTTVAIKTATANSILISVRAPVGRVNITRNRIAIGRGLAAINCKNNCQNFLYYLIKAFFFKDDIVGNGSIFSSISKQELCDLKFLVPEERLIRQFNEKVKSIDNKIDILDKQILLLKEARDRLLPKLMNGEIEL